jgi:hypothetical protein
MRWSSLADKRVSRIVSATTLTRDQKRGIESLLGEAT